jgi:hypothetical protein
MIKYVSRKDLNQKKYDDCIAHSNGLVYAYSWYLDIVSDHWSALVLDDYRAVMPLPWNSKLGLQYITQPFFCQSLGIYSKEKMNKSEQELLFLSIPKRFLKTDISVNFSLGPRFEKQVNYYLNLSRSYETIEQSYRKDRKKSLRKASQAGLTFQDFDNTKTLIQIYRDVFSFVDVPSKYYEIIQNLMDTALEKKVGFIRNVFYQDTLVCAGFFVHFKNRIYYLFAASNDEGKKQGATTFLIDSVIQQFANSKTIFDFEGSNIDSIASFYKSFGSEKMTYFKYSSNVIKGTVL